MKNLDEELKALRDSENRPPPSLQELEAIAEKMATPEYMRVEHTKAFVSRLLPECYTTFTFNNLNIKNFHEETLFFIFYALPESDLQLRAYNELIEKGYLYSRHLESFVLFTEPQLADNKRRTIIVFNPFAWEKTHREVLFDDKFISTLESGVNEQP